MLDLKRDGELRVMRRAIRVNLMRRLAFGFLGQIELTKHEADQKVINREIECLERIKQKDDEVIKVKEALEK